ncbi:MAG: glycine cleavage system protein R [Nitrospirota bacterium]|nr:glycine cleavage system protein R [Nitrospirota bacterium]MDH5587844.1 glycine cleavage system protein R [Nitrospirota bacterium]
MARALVLTVIGKDRPGLVEALADLIASHEGSWDESRMARLAGHFAGVVQIHLPEDQAEGFMVALPALADRGLSVSVVDSDWTLVKVDHRNSLQLEVIGQDRPGIVREISRKLAALGVSMQDLRTVVESAPMSGEQIFRAEAELAPPPHTSFEQIQTALEQLADDMMIDITLNTGA